MAPNLLFANNRLLVLARRARLRWPARTERLYQLVMFIAAFFGVSKVRRTRLRWLAQGENFYPLMALIAGILIVFIGTSLLLMANVLYGLTGVNLDFFLNNKNPNITQAVNLIIGFLPIYLLVWLWLRIMERRPFWTIGVERAGMGGKYLRGLAVGFLMFSASIGILAVLGYVEIAAVDFSSAVIAGILIVFLGWVVQGAAEEVLTRGFLMPVIGVRWGIIAGIIISSSLFALLHLFNPNLSWLAMLNLFLFGVFAALYALYEGGLWGVFAIHSIWNWAQGNVYGLEVSGTRVLSSTLMQTNTTGPDWLTGGAFGPEGGAAVSLVLIVSSLLVWFAQRRRIEAESHLS